MLREDAARSAGDHYRRFALSRGGHFVFHAFDGTAQGLDRAAGDGVGAVAGKGRIAALLGRQQSGAAGEGMVHEIEAGNDQPAKEFAGSVESIHRHGCAGIDDQAGALFKMPGSDQRRPAVGAELGGDVVEAGHAALAASSGYPDDFGIPQTERLAQAVAHPIARDIRDHDAGRLRQRRPRLA